MGRKNAQEIVKERYPQAEVVRSQFGLIVYTDDTQHKSLGDGRAYWEEEAWISAAEAMGK
jgi:hypothetical protein